MVEELQRTNHDLLSCIECFTEGEGGKQTKATHFGPGGERLCPEHAKLKPGCEPMTPGVPMSPVDLIRNFVFDHYQDEATMRQVYAEYWSPLEARCGGSTQLIEHSFKAFLTRQGFATQHRWELYKVFIAWWCARLTSKGNPAAVEEYATTNLSELLAGMRPGPPGGIYTQRFLLRS